MNLPLLAAAALGVYLLTSSGSKPKTPSLSSVPSDKGYSILIPCKMYDIYNEEASYKYAYAKFAQIWKKFSKSKNYQSDLNESLSKFRTEIFGCNTDEEMNKITLSPQYYAWVYRIFRAGLKAGFDNSTVNDKPLLDSMLNGWLQLLSQNGLDIQGLPTTIEGDFLQ